MGDDHGSHGALAIRRDTLCSHGGVGRAGDHGSSCGAGFDALGCALGCGLGDGACARAPESALWATGVLASAGCAGSAGIALELPAAMHAGAAGAAGALCVGAWPLQSLSRPKPAKQILVLCGHILKIAVNMGAREQILAGDPGLVMPLSKLGGHRIQEAITCWFSVGTVGMTSVHHSLQFYERGSRGLFPMPKVIPENQQVSPCPRWLCAIRTHLIILQCFVNTPWCRRKVPKKSPKDPNGWPKSWSRGSRGAEGPAGNRASPAGNEGSAGEKS